MTGKAPMRIVAFTMLGVVLAANFVSGNAERLSDDDCPTAPARLQAGDTAVVTDDHPGSLNIRVQPGMNEKVIGKIPQGDLLTIIAGPRCNDGHRWFEVGYEGTDGWSAEVGPDASYNMRPNGGIGDGPAQPDQQPNTSPSPSGAWPESLIGIWEGDVQCRVNFGFPELCHDVEEIWPDASGWPTSSGKLVGITNNNPAIGWEQRSYEKINDAFYFCFRLYDVLGDKNVDIGERCFRIVGDNELEMLGKDSAGYVMGTLLRRGTPDNAPPQGVMGCEPSNGKVQYGIINIGLDVFVIFCGEKRLVPNPITLDALGIGRNMMDNMGMSEAELTAIPRGTDIPDITRDPEGFRAFKELYDAQFGAGQGASPPLPSEPGAEPFGGQDETVAPQPGWCAIPIIGGLCNGFYVQAGDLKCDPQCMKTARQERPDMNKWIPPKADGSTTPADVIAAARKEKPFVSNNQQHIVSLRSTADPHAGDLVVWPKGCSGVPYAGGHIGYVKSVDGIIMTVTDSNWGKPVSSQVCSQRENAQVMVLPCMQLITSPLAWPASPALNPPGEDAPSAQLTDDCSQFNGMPWLWCMMGGQ